jgi:hypothetical protein
MIGFAIYSVWNLSIAFWRDVASESERHSLGNSVRLYLVLISSDWLFAG